MTRKKTTRKMRMKREVVKVRVSAYVPNRHVADNEQNVAKRSVRNSRSSQEQDLTCEQKRRRNRMNRFLDVEAEVDDEDEEEDEADYEGDGAHPSPHEIFCDVD